MVNSGLTEILVKELNTYYSEQTEKNGTWVNVDWDALFHARRTVDLIDLRDTIPFSRFFKLFVDEYKGDEDIEPEDWIMREFRRNDMGTNSPDKIRGSLKSDRVVWNRSSVTRLLNADQVTETEMFALAVGLHMEEEELDFFLRKVMQRSKLYFWNPEELILYATLLYIPEYQKSFYDAAIKTYNRIESEEWHELDEEDGDVLTTVIEDTTADLFETLEEESAGLVYEKDGELPEAFISFLKKYKYIVQGRKTHVRSNVRICHELLTDFALNAEEQLKSFRDRIKEQDGMSAKDAVGSLLAYYDPKVGLHIKPGDTFNADHIDVIETEDPATGKTKKKKVVRKVKVTALETREVPAVESEISNISVKVRCAEPCDEQLPLEDRRGYEVGHTEFETNDSRIESVSNKSKFKLVKQFKDPATGKKGSYITGKLDIAVSNGAVIEEGAVFTSKATGARYVTTESVKLEPFEELKVSCPVALAKNEVTGVGLKPESGITRLENRQIIFRTEDDREDEGKDVTTNTLILYKYLYGIKDESDESWGKMLDRKRRKKLYDVFLNDTKISQSLFYAISREKPCTVRRSDVLTLVFLSEMSWSQFQMNSDLEDTAHHKDGVYMKRWRGFLQAANEKLREAGFYELYVPNPYDSLIAYLAGNVNDPITTFRNLWLMVQEEEEADDEDEA